jgi:glycoside/pentoside/hexuronide:cation symporter, GPH family
MRESKVKLPTTMLLAYASLQFPLAMIGLPLAIYLAPFYAGELGLPLGALGLAMVLARMSDLVTDPIIGTLTDRWQPAIGRRRVWVPIGVTALGSGVWLLLNPPPGIGMAYFLATLALTYLGFTMTRLPYHAWGGELSDSYAERTRITSFRQTASLGGLILATLVPAWVLTRPSATAADVLFAMSVSMITILPICAALLYFCVPDRPAAFHADRVDWKRTLRQLRRNGPFLRLAIILLLGFIAETFRVTITLFFARDVIGVANVGIIYVYYFVMGLVAVPFWWWVSNRWGKHRALAGAFGIVIATNASIFFLHHGQVGLFTALFVAKGFCFGALELVPAAMMADAADVDTVHSRERRQGLLFAVMGMVVNFGQAVGQGLSLGLLDLIGYQAKGGNDADHLLWLQSLYALFPLLFLIPALWLILEYPLTAKRHARIRAHLDQRLVRSGIT